MALKAIVDNLDGVPEGARDFYTAGEDGKFTLAVEPVGGWALEDVEGLKSALGKERGENDRLKKQITKFGDIDVDRAREALSHYEQFKDIDPKKEADKIAQAKVEALQKQLLDKHAQEVAGKDERIGNLYKQVEYLLVDQVATAAIAEAKGSVELLLPHVRQFTRVKEAEGKFSVEIVDREGNPRISNAKGDPLDIKGFVAELRSSDVFGRAFDGTGITGGGTPPNLNGGGASLNRSKMTAQQKSEYIAKHGQSAFLKLPK